MKAKSSTDPRQFLAADVAAWIAVYGSVSGLVDFNTYAFASLAAATRYLPNSFNRFPAQCATGPRTDQTV